MQRNDPAARLPDPTDQAFNAWFGKTLRGLYEPVIHEELPPDIIALLRDMPRQH